MEPKILAAGHKSGGRNKLEERYLKYRHYYATIDICSSGEYGKAVYAPLLPAFDQWYKRKSLSDVPPNIPFLEDRLYRTDHPDFREERGGTISFHIKVLALSMIGLIMKYNRKVITDQILNYILFEVSQQTKSYNYSECLCFMITVQMFIEMLKEDFSHFGSQVFDLTLSDFANEETLNPKPQSVISIL